MADDKNKQGQQDRSRVSSSEPYEVEYLHSKYPNLSHQEIADAVKEAGPNREDVERYLDNRKKR